MILRLFHKNFTFNIRKIITSSFPDVVFERKTTAETIFSYCQKYNNRTVFIDDDKNINYTYSDLEKSVKNIASSLTKKGIQQGSMIGIIASNCPEHYMLQFAISSMGCTAVLYNPNYTESEIIDLFMDTKPTLIFTTEDVIEKVSKTVSQCSFIKDIYLIGNRKPGYKSFDDLINDSGNMNPIGHIKLDHDEHVAMIPYSSGTTGFPKGVMLTHTNLVSNFHQINSTFALANYVNMLVTLPLFHIYGSNVVGSMGIFSGSTMVFQSRFNPVRFLNAIDKYKINVLPIVPPQVSFLLNDPRVASYDLSSLTDCLCGAAPLDAVTERRFVDKIRAYQPEFEIYQGFGLTEASPMILVSPKPKPVSGKDGSVGLLAPNMLCKIVDVITREEINNNNTAGELLFKGPNIMKGYYNKPTETERSFENGWYSTGDLGYYDSDNYFYISDRIKELIKVKGFQVAPAELEGVLMGIPGIIECCVIGIPHEKYGEVPRAFVVKNKDINEKQIHDHMANLISDHKQLRGGIIFTNEIPKAPSGKILRKQLKNSS